MWAAFTMIDRADGGAHANYYMPRLQTWVDEDVFVTLDPPPGVIDDDQVVGTRRWRHLIYDRAQMERGRRCAAMQGVRRTWYCGNHVVGPPSHELAWIAGDLVARDLARALPGDS